MSTISTEFDIDRIITIDDSNARIIGIISILEGYYNSISKKFLKFIKSSKLEDVTLSELSIIYRNRMIQNKGMHGVCWEYFIYNSILNKDEYILDILNRVINGINHSENKTYESIDAILWGGEKKNLDLDIISNSINDDDFLWCYNKKIHFKNNLQLIFDSFRNTNNIRDTLALEFNSVWKADMFIKKSTSDMWYAVSIKWNKNELKLSDYNGLSIGIAFEDDFNKNNIESLQYLKLADSNIKAVCYIPFVYNLGQYFTDTFRLVNSILLHLNVDSSQSLPLYFPTMSERYVFDFLKTNKYDKCSDVINYLKDYHKIISNHEKIKSVLLTTQDKIIPSLNQKLITDNEIINYPVLIKI